MHSLTDQKNLFRFEFCSVRKTGAILTSGSSSYVRNILNFWKLVNKSYALFSFLKLAAVSDVFVENYVPGKLAEIGLGYEDIEKIAPHIVYCSITGIVTSVISVISFTPLTLLWKSCDYLTVCYFDVGQDKLKEKRSLILIEKHAQEDLWSSNNVNTW